MAAPVIIINDKEERQWIVEYLNCYKKNEYATVESIILKSEGTLTHDAISRILSNESYCRSGILTLYALYCYDPENDFVKWSDQITEFIKNELTAKKVIPRIFTSEYISKELDIQELHVQFCLHLIHSASNYFVSAGRDQLVGQIGYSWVTVGTSSVIEYKSINSLLEPFKENPRRKQNKENDKEITPPLRRVELAHKLDISQAYLSKQGSPWKKIFDDNLVDEVRSTMPLAELLFLVKDYYRKKNCEDKCPKTEKELRKMLS